MSYPYNNEKSGLEPERKDKAMTAWYSKKMKDTFVEVKDGYKSVTTGKVYASVYFNDLRRA